MPAGPRDIPRYNVCKKVDRAEKQKLRTPPPQNFFTICNSVTCTVITVATVSYDNMNHSSLGFYFCLPMTPTGACDTRRHPLLSLDSYYLQMPALRQYSRDQTQFNPIASQKCPLCMRQIPAGLGAVSPTVRPDCPVFSAGSCATQRHNSQHCIVALYIIRYSDSIKANLQVQTHPATVKSLYPSFSLRLEPGFGSGTRSRYKTVVNLLLL
jgi:hypothetical protein